MNRLQEIEQRLAAIKIELEADGADLNALETEVKALHEEREGIKAKVEQRKKLLETVANDTALPIIKTFEERKERKMEFENMTKEQIAASPEYRIAWLKNLQGAQLDEVEKRALTATAAMPESTANKIIETMVDMVPLLNEIELFRIPGNINVAVQTVAPTATREATAAAATEATATLTQVTLGGYNMNALIRVGADLAAMAIPAFEDWLVRKLSEAIAYKIEDFIINGDGVGDPKGIELYATWDVSDGTAVDWTGDTNTTLALADLDKAIGLIPAAYDRESKFLMSKKTFFANVSKLTDTNNWPVIEKDAGKFYLRGYEVIFSDKVTENDIFFGSFRRGMVGNLSSDIKVEKQRNLAYNCWDFLGWAVFDCEPAAAGCIVKIASDIAA